jgi:hypothetical protein
MGKESRRRSLGRESSLRGGLLLSSISLLFLGLAAWLVLRTGWLALAGGVLGVWGATGLLRGLWEIWSR